jgi:hypothetical protein
MSDTTVDVRRIGEDRFGVQITESNITTNHSMTVTQAMLDDVGLRDADPQFVVHEAFMAMLDHQPATAVADDLSFTDVTGSPELIDEVVRRVTA